MSTNAILNTSKADAPSFAGMNSVEIKVTVRPDQELRAERTMKVNEDTADVRLIYFYDTPDLDLFDAGIALRARLVKGDDDDSTVKFRSTKRPAVAENWQRMEGFKLEADLVGDRAVFSASLTHPQKRNEIDGVAEGKRPIEKLFSRDQESFLSEMCKTPVDFGKLRVMGPIRVLRWKLKHDNFDHELTVEEWRLPDGDDLVEVSIKVTPAQARQAQKQFDEHLKTLGLDPKGAQATKTRTALTYFADTLKEAAS